MWEKAIMRVVEIDLPDEIFLSLKEIPEGLSREIRMAAAAKLYRKFHPPNQEFAFRIKAYRILASKMWLLTYAN
jgi:hypothetical protein